MTVFFFLCCKNLIPEVGILLNGQIFTSLFSLVNGDRLLKRSSKAFIQTKWSRQKSLKSSKPHSECQKKKKKKGDRIDPRIILILIAICVSSKWTHSHCNGFPWDDVSREAFTQRPFKLSSHENVSIQGGDTPSLHCAAVLLIFRIMNLKLWEISDIQAGLNG